MTLGIVIPLKSKKVAKNWNATCDNLHDTINSITRQSSKNFLAVIVGHEQPTFINEIIKNHSNIFFQRLTENDPPVKQLDSTKNQILYEKDRTSKILKGIKFLREKSVKIKYWFPIDADDLIHRRLVEIIQEKTEFDAIIINNGYILYKTKDIINYENEFSTYCGSSAIISDNLVNSDAPLPSEKYQDFIFSEISHVNMELELRRREIKIDTPKERLVIYCRDNGENISAETRSRKIQYALKRKMKMYSRKIIFDKTIREDFGINDIKKYYL